MGTLHNCKYSKGPSNKIFVRILFAFNSCLVILIKWTSYYFAMCKCMSTTVGVNDIAEFTFFLFMRLKITIVTSCDSFIVIFVPYFFIIIKTQKWTEETRPKCREITYGFVKLVVIFFTFYKM